VAISVAASGNVARATTSSAAQASVTLSPGASAPFRAADFSHPAVIDNAWFPMKPGIRYVYSGQADLGDGLQPHRNVFTVTDLAKVISGVRTRVVWDLDYSAGELVEAELAFFAQDDRGNVWALGEYPEEYENGKFAGAPDVWIQGLAHARAGYAMLAHPRAGTPSYSQGFAPAIDFADRARVFRTGVTVRVPVGQFHPVLITDEWDALDPSGGHQRKYYARGVGNVKVTAVGGDLETLSLQRLVHLGPAGLAAVRQAAVVMDRRGHRVSPVYSRTAPVR
jgi:hypothetical protein